MSVVSVSADPQAHISAKESNIKRQTDFLLFPPPLTPSICSVRSSLSSARRVCLNASVTSAQEGGERGRASALIMHGHAQRNLKYKVTLTMCPLLSSSTQTHLENTQEEKYLLTFWL